jgi:hypothetical protein
MSGAVCPAKQYKAKAANEGGLFVNAARDERVCVARPSSNPSMLVSRDIGEIFPARRVVNQADDESPHDQPRVLIASAFIDGLCFWPASSDRQNGFVG